MNTQQLGPVSVAVALASVVNVPDPGRIYGVAATMGRLLLHYGEYLGDYVTRIASGFEIHPLGQKQVSAWDYSDVMQAYGNTTLLVDVTDY